MLRSWGLINQRKVNDVRMTYETNTCPLFWFKLIAPFVRFETDEKIFSVHALYEYSCLLRQFYYSSVIWIIYKIDKYSHWFTKVQNVSHHYEKKINVSGSFQCCPLTKTRRTHQSGKMQLKPICIRKIFCSRINTAECVMYVNMWKETEYCWIIFCVFKIIRFASASRGTRQQSRFHSDAVCLKESIQLHIMSNSKALRCFLWMIIIFKPLYFYVFLHRHSNNNQNSRKKSLFCN